MPEKRGWALQAWGTRQRLVLWVHEAPPRIIPQTTRETWEHEDQDAESGGRWQVL